MAIQAYKEGRYTSKRACAPVFSIPLMTFSNRKSAIVLQFDEGSGDWEHKGGSDWTWQCGGRAN